MDSKITMQIEIEREDGNARECGACCLPCFGESDSFYITTPFRKRLFTLCDKCSITWAEWRDSKSQSTKPES